MLFSLPLKMRRTMGKILQYSRLSLESGKGGSGVRSPGPAGSESGQVLCWSSAHGTLCKSPLGSISRTHIQIQTQKPSLALRHGNGCMQERDGRPWAWAVGVGTLSDNIRPTLPYSNPTRSRSRSRASLSFMGLGRTQLWISGGVL